MVITGKANIIAHEWFNELLEQVEEYDQAPVQSVLNDFGVFKELSNTLIAYREARLEEIERGNR